MKITKYPQSAFRIDYKNKILLIDPGSYCYNEEFTAENWGKVDILLITHNHSDHFVSDAVKVIKTRNPDVIILTTSEVKEILDEIDVKSEVIMSNETRNIHGINITGIKSIHGNLPDGKIPPKVIGFLIDNKVYHPGDTVYLYDKPSAEIVFVPISGTVTMNISEAVKFCNDINPKLIIPMHYDNPKYPVDANDFAKAMGDKALILNNGKTIFVNY